MPQTISQDKNTITNPYDSANIFNNYFSSFAETTKLNIQYSPKHFSDYLKHQFNNSILVQPTGSC